MKVLFIATIMAISTGLFTTGTLLSFNLSPSQSVGCGLATLSLLLFFLIVSDYISDKFIKK